MLEETATLVIRNRHFSYLTSFDMNVCIERCGCVYRTILMCVSNEVRYRNNCFVSAIVVGF